MGVSARRGRKSSIEWLKRKTENVILLRKKIITLSVLRFLFLLTPLVNSTFYARLLAAAIQAKDISAFTIRLAEELGQVAEDKL